MSFAFQEQWIKNTPGVSTNGRMPADIDLEHALICAELSVVSYRHFSRGKKVTEKTLGIERQHITKYSQVFGYQSTVLSTGSQQAVVFYNDRDVIVAFEGSSQTQLTHYNRNLLSYFMSWFQPAPEAIKDAARHTTGVMDAVPKVHWGFDNALNQPLIGDESLNLWEGVKREVNRLMTQKPDRHLYFTGHSSGGAIATIATARCFDEMPQHSIDGLYTFGQPRVGGKYFRAGLESKLGSKYYRFEQFGDPMPALPPYNEEEYVHAGQWIPMDMQGHVLKMNDGIDIKDTLSRSDKHWSGRIGQAYEGLMTSLRSAMEGSAILRELMQTVDPIARSTHSSLRNLFSAQNYSVHRAVSYSKALHSHIQQRWHSPRRRKLLAELEGQGLLYHLQSLEDFLKDADGVKLDEPFKRAVKELERSIGSTLDEWQRLSEHPPQVWLKRSQRLQDDADTPSFSLMQWFFGSEPTPPDVNDRMKEEAGEQSGKPFSAARMVRGLQRASRIEQAHDALNQFRHDIGHASADPKANWYVKELADMADCAFYATASYRSRMGVGISNQSRAM